MERLRYSRTIPGTQSFHSFIPNSITSVEMKPYSKVPLNMVTCAYADQEVLQLSTLKGYVCCIRRRLLAWTSYEGGYECKAC